MFKESNEARELAMYFMDKFKVKQPKHYFMAQMSIAKSLLNDYSLNDLKQVVDYLNINRPPNGMYSLKYITFVIVDVLPKARSYALREVIEDKGYDLTEVKVVANSQKRKKKKSMFK